MKSFICAMTLAALIITGSIIYSNILQDTMEGLENHVSTIWEHAQQEDWRSCQPAVANLMSQWEKTQNWLMTVVGHREINRIQEILFEIRGYAKEENREETLVKLGVLQMLFRQIVSNEEISLTNIL